MHAILDRTLAAILDASTPGNRRDTASHVTTRPIKSPPVGDCKVMTPRMRNLAEIRTLPSRHYC
jgi:hypothetical protein